MKPSFTIGIEEEYQTIDPETRDLRAHIDVEIIAKGKALLKEAVKPEMHQSVIEVGTSVCTDMQQARSEVVGLRRDMIALSKASGLRLAAGGTHPFADWRNQEIYPDQRYLSTWNKHGTKLMKPRASSEILPPPVQLLIVAMDHVPGRPAPVEVSGIAYKLGGHVEFLQCRIHLLGFLDRHAAVRFSMHK